MKWAASHAVRIVGDLDISLAIRALLSLDLSLGLLSFALLGLNLGQGSAFIRVGIAVVEGCLLATLLCRRSLRDFRALGAVGLRGG